MKVPKTIISGSINLRQRCLPLKSSCTSCTCFLCVGIDAAHELDIIPTAIAFNPKNGDMYVPSVVSYFNAKQTPFVNDLNNCLRNATLTCVVLVIDSHNNEIIALVRFSYVCYLRNIFVVFCSLTTI